MRFSRSELANGFATRDGALTGPGLEPDCLACESTLEHKLLFSLLYKEPLEIEDENIAVSMARFADIITMAEFCGLFQAVGGQITELVLNLPGLSKHVAEQPYFYLAMAMKLKSFDLFADAFLHFIGQKRHFASLSFMDLTPLQAAAAVLPASQTMSDFNNRLISELRALALTPYQAHADRKSHKRPPVARTAWLNAGFGKKSLEQKCRFLAGSIFREWLDQQLYGDTHWSHVKYSTTTPPDGEVKLGSLRKLCDTITKTVDEAGSKSNIFGINVPTRLSTYFSLESSKGKNPTAMLAREFGRLVVAARNIIDQSKFGFNKSGIGTPWDGFEKASIGKAKYDDDLEYFTFAVVHEHYMPWNGENEWEDLELDVSREPATPEWLSAVGIATN